jgi:4-hydroxy-tetrahydrodipicolinate reductase
VAGDLAAVLDRGEVLIDFTNPEATLNNLRQAAAAGKAVVIGTTGLSAAQQAEVKALAAQTRVVLAPNMSVGVNLMFKVVADIARVLSAGYDVEIVEAHHRLKKDAPSGTAVKLAQVIAQALQRNLDEVAVYERKGMIGQRTDAEIGIQTVRAGDIVGEHTVIFGGIGERLEIIHRAHNRDNFARGAVRAARWIVAQPPGLYDMQDVLGLK